MASRNALGLSVILCLFVVFAWAGAASAQMGPGMMGGYGGGYGYQSLTPEKQAAAQKIFANYQSQTVGLRQQLIVKRSELNALIYGDKPDDAKVQTLTKEISDLQAKLYTAQVALQRQLAKEDIPMMGGGYGGYGGMGPGMMGGGYGMMY